MLLIAILGLVIFAGHVVRAQPKGAPTPSPTVFFDSDGNRISNDEFVDIRMANFHLPDSTRMQTLDDGTVEFRLQKVPQEGMPLPDISVQSLDGRRITSADLRGKVVVLNFWFIGCPVCLAHKPKLNDLVSRFDGQKDVVFLAMSGESPAALERYLSKEPFKYIQAPNALTSMNLFGFVGYPKNIVVSRTGEIVYWRSTIKAWDKFESVIKAELER